MRSDEMPQPPLLLQPAGVFLALIFGAFLNGSSPSIAAGHQGSTAAPITISLSASYNRWALEALTLAEFQRWGEDRRSTIFAMARSIGLCGLDMLPDNGDTVLDEVEALAFLKLQQQWNERYCDPYRATAQGALFIGGAVLRVLAWLVLCVTYRLPFWHSQ
jgi:hypothetical protein